MSTFYIHVVFLHIIFNPCIALLIIKTATIDPNTPNLQNNGATITELDVNTSHSNPTEWRLYNPSSNNGFHLQLNLNSSWGFHPTEDTNLTMEVNADGNTVTATNYHELMAAFTQTNSNQFFATKIYIDESLDNKFYPFCHLGQDYTGDLVTGNVKSIVDTDYDGYDQYWKATSGGDTWGYGPFIDPAERNVEPPLTFIFLFSPRNSRLKFTYTNPGTISRSCALDGSYFASNVGMDIYFASNSIWSSVDISSITVTLSYEITDNPTQNPTTIPTYLPTPHITTSDPTINPSRYPTNSPTMNPTRYPIKYPTNSPTINPTVYPTNSPTINPSINPSRYPIKYPTNSPTINPIRYPTNSPTLYPSLMPTYVTNSPSTSPTLASYHPTYSPTDPQSIVEEDISSTGFEIDSNSNVYESGKDNYLVIIIVCISSVVMLIIITGVILFLRNRKKVEHDTIAMETQLHQIQTTEMVVTHDVKQDNINKQNSIETNVAADLYKAQSVERIGVITPKSDVNSLLDLNGITSCHEGDNDQWEEGMYDVVQLVQTAGFITDKGEHLADINDDKITPDITPGDSTITMGNGDVENDDELMK